MAGLPTEPLPLTVGLVLIFRTACCFLVGVLSCNQQDQFGASAYGKQLVSLFLLWFGRRRKPADANVADGTGGLPRGYTERLRQLNLDAHVNVPAND